MNDTQIRIFPRKIAQDGPLKLPEQPPTWPLKEVHRWADYVELRCLISADDELSLDDVANWLRGDPSEAPDEDPSDSTPATGAETDVSQVEDGQDAPPAETSSSSRKSDNRVRLAGDIFRLMRQRGSLYGSTYPFSIDPGRFAIQRRPTLSEAQRRYVFMLLCSLGPYVRGHRQLVKDFERVCVPAIEAMLPTAVVNIFGTASDGGSPYTGRFVRKLKHLARDLGEARPKKKIRRRAADESGDRGLDVVGIVDLGDHLSSKLTVFAQAACTPKWIVKQDAASPHAWDKLLLVTSPAVSTCCIPFCYRDAQGTWHDDAHIHRTLLLDRARLLRLLGNTSAADLAREIKSWSEVDAVLRLSLPS